MTDSFEFPFFAASTPASSMRTITLQVLEGLERGQTFEDLPIPVSIGREEENTIRLNDERISRFHAKIQEDGGRTILTDLDSTNGTRVNGRPVQMRVLKAGDHISLGRCLLVFGSEGEIRARIEKSRGNHLNPHHDDEFIEADEEEEGGSTLHAAGPLPDAPPELPTGLTPGQRAQVADILSHIHDEIRQVALASEEFPSAHLDLADMRVPGPAWQRLLRLEMDLAVALRNIGEPDPLPTDPSIDSPGAN